jgi:hypothetical protein
MSVGEKLCGRGSNSGGAVQLFFTTVSRQDYGPTQRPIHTHGERVKAKILKLNVRKMRDILRNRSCGSSGSIVSDYGPDNRGSITERGRGLFF